MVKNYKAIDIAKYLIKYSAESGNPVTNLYLQKILYYLQKQSLVSTGNILYKDDIVAWKHGPVVEDVYYEFVAFGSCPIESETIKKSIIDIDTNTRRMIEEVVNEKMKKSSWKLAAESCNEAPWLKATSNGKYFNGVISIEMMKEL